MTVRKHRPVVKQDVNEQSAYELWCWGGPARADEIVEFHKSRTPNPINPENVRKLAAAMIQGAFDDLRRFNSVRSYYFQIGREYRPDQDGAHAWLFRDSDEPLSFVWCCQVLKLEPSAIRRKVPKKAPPFTLAERSEAARIRQREAVRHRVARHRARARATMPLGRTESPVGTRDGKNNIRVSRVLAGPGEPFGASRD